MEVPAPNEMIARIRALPTAAPLLAALRAQTGGVYLAGGAVRDLLRDQAPLDLDVVVEGDALGLAQALGGVIRSHGRFGTGTVRLDGHSYDFATARRERYVHPGALPDVTPATIEEDLERRDFTVNALAVPLTGARAGRVLAVDHGLEDLRAGRMRILHAASFRDDPTRLLRLVRYASRLAFDVEPETARLAREAVNARALDTVSAPRVGAELRLAAQEPDPVGALAALAPWNLDHAIHPAFRLATPEVARAAMALLPAGGRTDRVVLAAAARDIEAAQLAALLDRLGFTAADRQTIVAAARGAAHLAAELGAAETASQIAAAVGSAPDEAVALAGALGAQDAARRWLSDLRDVRLEITGADLLDAGVPPGPALGRGLAAALAAKRDGQVRDRAEELDAALTAISAQG